MKKTVLVRITATGAETITPERIVEITLLDRMRRGWIDGYEFMPSAPVTVKREYVAESSGSNKYGVYEYLCGMQMRAVQVGLSAKEAYNLAGTLNGVVALVLLDNGLEAHDAK